MKRKLLISLIGVGIAAFGYLMKADDAREPEVLYTPVPFQELISEPHRYGGGGIKTFGFIHQIEEHSYVLVSQRDRGIIFDMFTRISLDDRKIKKGRLTPELSGHIVYVEGLFVDVGGKGDPPGAFVRRIIVNEIYSPEVTLEDSKEP